MFDNAVPLPVNDWPYTEVLTRLALGLVLGLLIGLERERRGKEAGVRTFGFIGLLGAIGGMLGVAYGWVAVLFTLVLALLLNASSLRAGQGTELTTSAAMGVTVMAGLMSGLGHTIAPAAVMVISTALLAWKERLAGFSVGISEREIRSALLLAILAIVIYPALPEGAVGPLGLIQPRVAWIAVILIAGIGFFNYVLWKIYGTRGAELSSFFGGLINSNFTVISLAQRVREVGEPFVGVAYRGVLLAMVAMLARNAMLLLLLAPIALAGSFAAFGLMLAVAGALMGWSMHQRAAGGEPPEIDLQLPFSLSQALKYGFIFLLLHVLGAVTQRQFGDAGFYIVSVVGGFLSSASSVAAAAALAAAGDVSPATAGTGAVLASFTSMAFSLAFVLNTRRRSLVRSLVIAMVAIGIAGLAGILISHWTEPWMAQLLETFDEKRHS